MTLFNIDDRLASLADVATRTSVNRRSVRRRHACRVAVDDGDGTPPADLALELVGLSIEALATSDAGALRSLCTTGIHVSTPSAETVSVEELISSMRGPADAFTEVEVSVDWLVASRLDVAAEWRVHATHTGPLHVAWAVIEATGQSVALDGTLIGHLSVEHAGNRLVFDDLHLHYDGTALPVQLGLA